MTKLIGNTVKVKGQQILTIRTSVVHFLHNVDISLYMDQVLTQKHHKKI